MPLEQRGSEWRDQQLLAALQDACLKEASLQACNFDSLLTLFRDIGSFEGQRDTRQPFMRTQRHILTSKITPLLEAAPGPEAERLSRELIHAYENAQVNIAKLLYPAGSEMLAVVDVVTHYGAHFAVDGIEVGVQCISVIKPEWHSVIQKLAPGEGATVVVDHIDEARRRWNVRPVG